VHRDTADFQQRLILPEEERRQQPCPPYWNGSYRWFRSANIVDLWNYRSSAEKQRIIDFMWRRQLALCRYAQASVVTRCG
jgi:hypothetical protein